MTEALFVESSIKLSRSVSPGQSKFPDDEHRIFYTGITRTKENLHIIESGAKYRYEL